MSTSGLDVAPKCENATDAPPLVNLTIELLIVILDGVLIGEPSKYRTIVDLLSLLEFS